jgi:NitT/TauT family transport system ATP-binding protein
MTGEPFVAIRDVSKRYATPEGRVFAVDAVSLDVRRGEFVALVGPSGCGKTTLMLILAGLLPRDDGTVHIDGAIVDAPYTDVGIVFQDHVLLDWRSVIDNLLLQAEIRGLDRGTARERGMDLLARVGLEGFARRRPWELSGGMRQRASLCRALVHDPALLLMDEPFGALDALTREDLALELEAIGVTGSKTVLFITHSITEAVFLADRVIVMSPRPGRIVAEIAIDLPRPREPGLRESPLLAAHARRIRAVLEQTGALRRRGVAAGAAAA